MSSEEKIPQPTTEATKIPTTVNEGFETKPPTPGEKSEWDQHKAEVRRSHDSNDSDTAQDWTPNVFPVNGIEKKPLSLKKKLLAGIAGVALLAGGIGIGVGATNNNQATPVAEAPADPTVDPTVEPAPTEAPQSPEVVSPEAFAFTSETMEQTVSIEAMESMGLTEFANLPYADRAAYMIANTPESAQVASMSLEDNMVYDVANTPDIITSVFMGQIDTVAYGTGDADVRAKYYGGNFYYTATDDGLIAPSFEAVSQDVVSKGATGTGTQISYQFEGAGAFQSGTDRYGNPIDFINVTVTPINDYTGEVSQTKTIQTLRVPVTLLDGSTVYMYPSGYVTEGTASPIEGGTY